jgi:hypothetical protein
MEEQKKEKHFSTRIRGEKNSPAKNVLFFVPLDFDFCTAALAPPSY